ncbi:hypothetical protein ABW19_dt0205979 [Dactylella cylindrospora]|nr:hypothetical protein ABW19_dt0205979 [Dactylella cylindrospora]
MSSAGSSRILKLFRSKGKEKRSQAGNTTSDAASTHTPPTSPGWASSHSPTASTSSRFTNSSNRPNSPQPSSPTSVSTPASLIVAIQQVIAPATQNPAASRSVHGAPTSTAGQSAPSAPTLSTWDTAFQQLNTTDRLLLAPFRADKTATLSGLLSLAKDAQAECERKRWKITYTRKGVEKTVVLQEVVNSIARWFDKLKQFGDIAVQYDPAPAALPWAAFRFLMDNFPHCKAFLA